jgi:hypothetical protein
MSSSLSRFSGWSLSLGEGLMDSTGARDGTRADGVLDRGRRRLFSFWRYGLAAPSSYRVDRGRHRAASTFGGVGFSAGALVVFILWRWAAEESGAAKFGFGGAMPGRPARVVRSQGAPIPF